tara:strand:+ start:2448 stop:3563 length:1116 start_codon:yes stop_codon:yes gene_type:complete
MKIVIAASHRFHLLDLARELAELGHDVKFYSYVPTKRVIKYGLKRENSKSLFLLMLPFLGLIKLSKNKDWSIKLKDLVLDNYLYYFMPKCDVYIALGTVYLKSIKKAKKKGAITILEWGSKHIIEQQNAIAINPNFRRQKPYFINRSLKGYEICDYISIPSTHVKDSFVKHGIELKKLLINPYGVDTSMFRPTILDENENYDIIMVGNWSITKGCDLIINTLQNTSYTFLHVGAIKDLDFPKEENFTHIDPVDQIELVKYYSKAKVFLLPSRAEGLAMVQAQAIACGLPVVCSKNTGGIDLNNFLTDKKWIIELENTEANTILTAIQKALKLFELQEGSLRNYVKDDLFRLSWSEYGKRYETNLNRKCLIR